LPICGGQISYWRTESLSTWAVPKTGTTVTDEAAGLKNLFSNASVNMGLRYGLWLGFGRF
jgi:hypothetical protein